MGNTWVGASAAQIAHAVQRGDATATAVVADHVEHAVPADRVVTAIRVLRAAAALAEAEQVDELPDLAYLPLAGVPVLVQENTPVAGAPTGYGSGTAEADGRTAESDHEMVRRLRGAGAVVLGTSRMSELGLWPTTDDATGVTRNPWRTDRSAGGSAGGSAAAVAAGIVPIAHGTDQLVAAACCGVVGFRPGRGVIPYDLGQDEWFGHGVFATTVADAALGFAVLAGREPVHLPAAAPGPADSAPAAPATAGAGPSGHGRLRVAVALHNPTHASPPDADTRDGVARAARLLVAAGHDVVRAEPPLPVRLTVITTATWLAVAHRQASAHPDTQYQARTQRHAALGARALRRGLVRDGERADWRDRCVSWLAEGGFDLVLMPALAGPPPPAQQWSGRPWRVNAAMASRFAPYVAPWSLAGLPALVIPVGERRDGLPAAVQLIGGPGAEERLLAVAAQLESAAPWRPHAPSWPRVEPVRRTGAPESVDAG